MVNNLMIAQTNTKFFDHIPMFTTQKQMILVTQLRTIQQLNQKTAAHLVQKIQSAQYVHEKSIIETMIVSMNNAMR